MTDATPPAPGDRHDDEGPGVMDKVKEAAGKVGEKLDPDREKSPDPDARPGDDLGRVP